VQCLQEEQAEDAKEGASMMQQKEDDKKDGKKYNSKGEHKCYHCGGEDHWATDCPELDKEQRGGLYLMDVVIVSHVKQDGSEIKTGGVRRNWLYADTCSTNDFMVNPTYLTGVHAVDEPLRIHTNACSCVTSQQGFLGSQLFWLDRNGIANVISLRSLEMRHRVTYDSTKNGGAFVVHTPEGEVLFKRCPDTGFPYVDLDNALSGGAMLVQTVRRNYEGFTKRDIIKAHEARELQGKLSQLSATEMKQLLREKEKVLSHALLHNCPVTMQDFENANTIFGPSIDRLNGASVRTKPHLFLPRYTCILLTSLGSNHMPLLTSVSRSCHMSYTQRCIDSAPTDSAHTSY
jgi:hypothetical protein